MPEENELETYIKTNTDFLRLADGESFEGTYEGVEFIADRFDLKNKQLIPEYKLRWKDIEKTIGWATKSMRVANSMKDIKQGESIKITRHGEDTKTIYEIEKV